MSAFIKGSQGDMCSVCVCAHVQSRLEIMSCRGMVTHARDMRIHLTPRRPAPPRPLCRSGVPSPTPQTTSPPHPLALQGLASCNAPSCASPALSASPYRTYDMSLTRSLVKVMIFWKYKKRSEFIEPCLFVPGADTWNCVADLHTHWTHIGHTLHTHCTHIGHTHTHIFQPLLAL